MHENTAAKSEYNTPEIVESEFFFIISLIIILKINDFKRLKFVKSFVITKIYS